jgi:hypothetical protein
MKIKKLEALNAISPWMSLFFLASALPLYWPAARASWFLYQNLVMAFGASVLVGITSIVTGTLLVRKTGVRSGLFNLAIGLLTLIVIASLVTLYGFPDRTLFELKLPPVRR